jgi:hypothetical protein
LNTATNSRYFSPARIIFGAFGRRLCIVAITAARYSEATGGVWAFCLKIPVAKLLLGVRAPATTDFRDGERREKKLL